MNKDDILVQTTVYLKDLDGLPVVITITKRNEIICEYVDNTIDRKDVMRYINSYLEDLNKF